MPGRKFFPVSLLFVLYLLYSATSLFPFSRSDEQPKELEGIHEEIKVDLVNVYLTATDSKGSFVTDLRREELTLKEDGVPQGITNFAHSSETPLESLTVVILIDTSMSMSEKFQNLKKIDMAKKGALLLLNQLKPQDRMLLIRFSDRPFDAIGLTFKKESMKAIVQSLKADNGLTTLLDALDLAIKKLKDVGGYKLIFICSDGEDTASKHTTRQILDSLKNAFDVTVVTLGINALQASSSEGGQSLRDGRTLLQSIADNSGGYAFFPRDLKELDLTMEKLKLLIPSRYFLGYHPTNSNTDRSWRNIEITCTRPGVNLKYRTGYFAK